jgi:hypothetical protein
MIVYMSKIFFKDIYFLKGCNGVVSPSHILGTIDITINLIHTSLIFNPNYFISHLPHPPTWIWKSQINIWFFIVQVTYINSNWIKFEIDINNDELLETIHGNKRRGGKKNWSPLVMWTTAKPKLINIILGRYYKLVM